MDTPILWHLVTIAIMIGILMGLAGPLTWAERRQSAMIQDRIGPNRAGFNIFGKRITAFGLLHPLADALKMITKEDTINVRVDRFLYNIAPIIALIPALVTFAVVPFGPDIVLEDLDWVLPLQVARIDAGALYVFAISSLAVFGVTLAGYASASRLAMMGGLRASAQMISYEVTMGLSVMGLFLVYGTLEPYAMVLEQGELLWGWLPAWGIFMQPLAFVIFLTAAIAENKRVPFDLAEGASEIVVLAGEDLGPACDRARPQIGDAAHQHPGRFPFGMAVDRVQIHRPTVPDPRRGPFSPPGRRPPGDVRTSASPAGRGRVREADGR